jgi:hypothetical protein
MSENRENSLAAGIKCNASRFSRSSQVHNDIDLGSVRVKQEAINGGVVGARPEQLVGELFVSHTLDRSQF